MGNFHCDASFGVWTVGGWRITKTLLLIAFETIQRHVIQSRRLKNHYGIMNKKCLHRRIFMGPVLLNRLQWCGSDLEMVEVGKETPESSLRAPSASWENSSKDSGVAVTWEDSRTRVWGGWPGCTTEA